MPDSSAHSLEDQCQAVLQVVDSKGGVIRKQAGSWVLKSLHLKRTLTVPPAVVAALLAKGHLVTEPSGGLGSRARLAAAKGQITTHRPPRPPAGAVTPCFNDAESPLAWLRARKSPTGKPLISDQQYLAGERLRADYEKSRLERRVTASWDAANTANANSGNRVADMTDAMIAARQNFHAALDAVGPELSGMLVQICCLSAGIEQAERLLELPQRAGKAVLALGLTSLARHYGFLRHSRSSDRQLGIAHWGAEDYRPAIPPPAGS